MKTLTDSRHRKAAFLAYAYKMQNKEMTEKERLEYFTLRYRAYGEEIDAKLARKISVRLRSERYNRK